MKKLNIKKLDFKTVIKGFFIILGIYLLLAYPRLSAQGVKNGINLVVSDLIPALFPFMVLSSYIANGKLGIGLIKYADCFMQKIFKTSGKGLLPFVLGALGGYPVGAKTVSELYEKGEITKNEAERLFYWCINPSPSFAISAVGTFMLGSTKKGIIIYFCCILASLTVGCFCRYLNEGKTKTSYILENTKDFMNKVDYFENNFVNSVTSAGKAMLNLASWVIVFSAAAEILTHIISSENGVFWIKALAEVTAGSKTVCAAHCPLPVISAVISFGGFAVICQVLGYSEKCKVQWKRIFASRLITCAVATVYTGFFLKLFPEDIQTSVQISLPTGEISLYHSVPTAIILILMCITLILEVDKSEKVC